MTHYYLSRGHADSGCYELKDAKLEVMRELNEGMTILISRGETSKIREVIDVMDDIMDYGGWDDSEWHEIGQRNWQIRQCHDYGCSVGGEDSW